MANVEVKQIDVEVQVTLNGSEADMLMTLLANCEENPLDDLFLALSAHSSRFPRPEGWWTIQDGYMRWQLQKDEK